MIKNNKKRRLYKPYVSKEISVLSWLEKVAVILASFGGVAVAVLWITGRSYAAGYFRGMNIPLYELNFSIWEYGEQSWWVVVFGFIFAYLIAWIFERLANLIGSLIGSIIYLLIVKPIKRITKLNFIVNLRKKYSKHSHEKSQGRSDGLKEFLKDSDIILRVFMSVFILLIISNYIGKLSAHYVIQYASPQVEFVSTSPQSLGTPLIEISKSDSGISTLYIYSGYKLLTYNNGKYYFFREIDPKTCSPEKVFVIAEKEYTQINIFPAKPTTTVCTTTSIPEKYFERILDFFSKQ